MIIRKLVVVLFIGCAHAHLFAQLEPVQNSIGTLKELGVKSVSTSYYNDTDTSEISGRLILKKEFDANGNITKKYLLSLWEAVSYDYTTSFSYDSKGYLIEENKIQTILNLGTRDQQYIESFGDKPLHERIKYAYNEDGELVGKEIFTFSTDELPAQAEPIQKLVYEYESGRLTVERSSSIQSKIFNQNYEKEYLYDGQNRLAKKIVNYGAEMEHRRSYTYTYDSLDQLVEEKIQDNTIARNNAHYKYIYYESGLLKSKLIYDNEEEIFVEEISYSYDEQGNRISGEKEVVYTYYDNGLIQSERWNDDINDQIFYFVSRYTFH